MREIKFRGISRKDGNWFFGLPMFTSGGVVGIIAGWMGEDGFEEFSQEEVIPETVSQYTGFKDKAGVEIYDKDIVDNGYGIYEITYLYFLRNASNAEIRRLKVVGNIFQNPELLREDTYIK
jgi:hypothetical protein